MLFNSLAFAVFLPVVFALYWLLQKKSLKYQNILLLLASYYFYGSWDVRFLSLILLSSIVDFFVGNAIFQSQDPRRRKQLLLISLIFNIGLLGVFKYFNFFVSSFVDLGTSLGLDMSFTPWEIILPVGISFYTFQTISYSVDIYRGHFHPTRDPVAFFTFVAFFPQLVAGPIERARDLLPQFLQKRMFDPQFATEGLQMILWGMFKKVVIADQIALYINPIFGSVDQYSGLTLFLASLGFGILAYCDFSGYSDIAIGTARLFGFRLSTNFRAPFFATSIREFWNRWHMTLFSWFRDYIYFPMGGSRVPRGRWMFNILVVFGISGLWHGAAMTYVSFGLAHGCLYLGEWLINRRLPAKKQLPPWINGLSAFFFVTLTWTLFRAVTISDALYMLANMPRNLWQQLTHADAFVQAVSGGFVSFREGVYLLLSLGLFVFLEILIKNGDPTQFFSKLPKWTRWLVYYLLIFWLLVFGAYESVAEFIYFQF